MPFAPLVAQLLQASVLLPMHRRHGVVEVRADMEAIMHQRRLRQCLARGGRKVPAEEAEGTREAG